MNPVHTSTTHISEIHLDTLLSFECSQQAKNFKYLGSEISCENEN
jgi:hypothetical protein